MDTARLRWKVGHMKKRDRIARAAAISNGMVWFGLSLFLGVFAVQLAPAAFAGEWYTIAGWALIALAALGLLVMGLFEQRTMRAARMKYRHAP
jgi:fumarate reductase subunit C